MTRIKPQDCIAFDRASVRSFDDMSGHLHVAEANLSCAAINPYLGSEIPDWQALGLDPHRTYRLLRDPRELAAAAGTMDGRPLLLTHKATTALDHDHFNVAGAISEPRFEHPHLKGKIVVWTQDGIDAIESGRQRELSCGYHYSADMTPGRYEGERYDGVMRDLSFNHCALVAEGRAGPTCMVGDSAYGMEGNRVRTATRRRYGCDANSPGKGLLVGKAPPLGRDAGNEQAFRDHLASIGLSPDEINKACALAGFAPDDDGEPEVALDARFPHMRRLDRNNGRGDALRKSFGFDRIKHDPYENCRPAPKPAPRSASFDEMFPNARRLKTCL